MWTQELVDLLGARIAAGRTYREIAVEFGRSREAIAGQVYRQGFKTPNGKSITRIVRKPRRPKRATIQSVAQINLVPRIVPPSNEPEPMRIGLMQLTPFHCRNPLDETGDDCTRLFCGHPVEIDSSWCPFHHALFTVKVRR